jgi:hypothetical protein
VFPLAADNEWRAVSAAGAAPGCLQEHSVVGYRDALYVFGGEVGFSNATETPLWIYEIKVRSIHSYEFLRFDGCLIPLQYEPQ